MLPAVDRYLLQDGFGLADRLAHHGRYDLAGSLLATAIAAADRTGEPLADCLGAGARTAGRCIGHRGCGRNGIIVCNRMASA